ncbi:MAG: M20/M25/M40 family metallo-hydrolase, partial [Clostridia bacterium]|nr:M20/M25/M40 family metallo-hydrolase [Clostridia bacterium]
IAVNYRIPAPLTRNDLIAVLDKFGFKYTIIEQHEPVMVEKDGWFVQTMLNAFNTVRGEKAVPISMGGSTFARAFKQGCAFGPDFKTYETNCHDANERIKETDLLAAYEIYKATIFGLAK